MQNPDNLEVAHLAEELAIAIYDYTAAFPIDERFGLTSQMRRAAVSVGSNIFEGCGMKTNKHLGSFLYRSYGSSGELIFQGRIARRRSFGLIELADVVDHRLFDFRRKMVRLIGKVDP